MQKLLLFLTSLSVIMASCQNEAAHEERLARTHCGSCHQFPEPALLDKKTWTQKVLPEMAFRMGVDFSSLISVSEEEYPFVIQTLPKSPMVSAAEWEAIVRYFEREAPDTIVLNGRHLIQLWLRPQPVLLRCISLMQKLLPYPALIISLCFRCYKPTP